MKDYRVIWISLIATWISIYSIRTAFSPTIPSIMLELKISYADAGLASSAIFYTYASMQFFAGFLGTRYGRRRMLILGTFLNGTGSLLTSLASNFYQLLSYRLLTGIGAGLVFSNDRPLISHYTPRGKLGLGQGLSFSGGGMGVTLGVVAGGLIVTALGWRPLFQLLTIPAMIALFLIFLTVEEPVSRRLDKIEFSSLGKLFRSRDYLILVLSGIPLHYAFWVLAVWLPTILVESKIADLAVASYITALLGIAAPIGLVVLGRLSDVLETKGGSEKPVLVGAAILLITSLLAVSLTYQAGGAVTWILIATFAAGFAIWGAWAPHYRILSRIVGEETQPIAFGLMNGVHFFGSIISPYVTGLIRDLYGTFSPGLIIASLLPLLSAILYSKLSIRVKIGA